jgi:hypothetical protein
VLVRRYFTETTVPIDAKTPNGLTFRKHEKVFGNSHPEIISTHFLLLVVDAFLGEEGVVTASVVEVDSRFSTYRIQNRKNSCRIFLIHQLPLL